MTRGGITVAQARRVIAGTLRDAGLDSPGLDARILVGHALALDHTALVTQADRALSDAEAAQIDALAARRLAHEPVARIVGVKEFWGLSLVVTPDVLVPRPDTETVVELALTFADRTRPLRILDLGTGSGAILLALLHELPNARGVATDIALAALRVARANASALGLAPRAAFVRCDFGQALAGPFDLVVSNPPYIASAGIAKLAPEVRDHDPRGALDGGADGLAAYRAIIADAPRLLGSTGRLVIEVGAGQAAAVMELFRSGGLADAGLRHDLSGVARAVAAAAFG